MSKRLKRHETIPNLTADDVASPEDGIESPHPLGIAEPRIFMLSEAIKNTLESSFTGLQSTLTNISTQMERITSRPSSFHAQRADARISIRTSSSTHTRVSASRQRAATSADGSPPRLLAVIVPIIRRTAPQRPPSNMEGGIFQMLGETYPRKMRAMPVMQLVCFLQRTYL